jgi:Predicted membrane protein
VFTYSDVTIKLALGLLTIILQINLSGKSNLAPISALDQVQNYVLGAIVGGMIYSTSVTVLQYILVLLIWMILVAVLRFLTKHNRYVKWLIDGRPQLLIENGQLKVATALKNGMSANDLALRLRTEGVTDIRFVKRAVLEQNGQLTVTKKGDDSIKYPLIVDGQLNADILDDIHRDRAWLDQQLASYHCAVKDVYLATYVDQKLLIFPYIR